MTSNQRKQSAGKKRKRQTIGELNAWMEQQHDTLLKEARENCLRLTGKPTFGGAKRRKSA